MAKDKLKDDLKAIGLWKHQYQPRLTYLKKVHAGNKEILNKLNKMKTKELIARIDRMESAGIFRRMK